MLATDDCMVERIFSQLTPIFTATSIAVIGASNDSTKWGYRMVDRPLKTGYRGAIYPVNEREKFVLGLPAYPNISTIPYEVDLAVIAVPAVIVPRVLTECIAKGIKGAVVITAGFAEIGEAGAAIQNEMVKVAQEGKIRLIGPNGMGIWSSAVRLNLAFNQLPRQGRIAFVSQSGSFGTFLCEVASNKGYGFSKFISAGNQADLDAADYLEYLGEDKDSAAIVFYMEGLKDAKRFMDTARQVVKRKPVIVYKAGRSEVAVRAAMSHTASLAGSDEIFDVMCKQVGIIRVDEASHLFDIAQALISQPLPPSNRIAVIGSGGQGVVTSEACASLGLEIPMFDEETKLKLKKQLPPHAPTPNNPLDFAGGARTPLDEARVAEAVAQLDYIDGIIMNLPVMVGGQEVDYAISAIECAKVLSTIPEKYGKPIILFKWHPGSETDLIHNILLKHSQMPCYETLDQCARSMYALVKYAEIRRELGG